MKKSAKIHNPKSIKVKSLEIRKSIERSESGIFKVIYIILAILLSFFDFGLSLFSRLAILGLIIILKK